MKRKIFGTIIRELRTGRAGCGVASANSGYGNLPGLEELRDGICAYLRTARAVRCQMTRACALRRP